MSYLHPKTAAAGVAGATVTILVWIASLFSLDVPAEVAAAATTIIAAAAAYLAPRLPTEK